MLCLLIVFAHHCDCMSQQDSGILGGRVLEKGQGSGEKKTWKRGAAGEGTGREKLEVWRGS